MSEVWDSTALGLDWDGLAFQGEGIVLPTAFDIHEEEAPWAKSVSGDHLHAKPVLREG